MIEFDDPVTGLLAQMTAFDGMKVRLRVTGISMWPWIRSGEFVRVSKGRIKPGAVVAFISPSGNRLYMHRVIRMTNETIVCRGDMCVHEDEPVTMSSVLGRLMSVERGGRQIRFGMTRCIGISRIVSFGIRTLLRVRRRMKRNG